MKKEDAISLLKQVNEILINSNSWLENTHEPLNQAFDMAIKALEKDNDEIFKQFKTKAFYESEDILGLDMVDTYRITDYLAELLGVEND